MRTTARRADIAIYYRRRTDERLRKIKISRVLLIAWLKYDVTLTSGVTADDNSRHSRNINKFAVLTTVWLCLYAKCVRPIDSRNSELLFPFTIPRYFYDRSFLGRQDKAKQKSFRSLSSRGMAFTERPKSLISLDNKRNGKLYFVQVST